MKNLVRDPSHPEAHLGNSVKADVSARFMSLVMEKQYDMSTDFHHTCVLSSRDLKFSSLSHKEVTDLRMLGHTHVDCLSASGFKIAYIMGVHFRAGEWGRRPRCGSVITTTRVFLYPRFVSIIFNYRIMNYLTFLLLLVSRGVIRTMRAS